MEVMLIAYTQMNPDFVELKTKTTEQNIDDMDPEWACAIAMRSCQAPLPAHRMTMNKEKVKVMINAAKQDKHFSVLEHVTMMFSIGGVSRALTHQLVRHRIATFSQQSQRHVKLDKPTYVLPDFPEVQIMEEFESSMEQCWESYNKLREMGVKPEDARFVLPNACTTNIVVSMNAHALLHFFKLRLDEHAQWEIRELANRMFAYAIEIYPTIFNSIPDGV